MKSTILSILLFATFFISVSSDLIGYWGFEEQTGLVSADKSGNGRNFNLTDTDPSQITSIVDGWTTAGKFGGAYQFVPTSTGLSGTFGTYMSPVLQDFTIAFWIKTNETLPGQDPTQAQFWNSFAVIACDTPGSNSDDFTIILASFLGVIGIGYGNSDTGSEHTLVGGISVSDNNWHFATVTRSVSPLGSNYSIYIDGVLDTSILDGGKTNRSSTQATIAKSEVDYKNLLAVLDEIRVYDNVLGNAEIQDLKSLNQIPSTTGVIVASTGAPVTSGAVTSGISITSGSQPMTSGSQSMTSGSQSMTSGSQPMTSGTPLTTKSLSVTTSKVSMTSGSQSMTSGMKTTTGMRAEFSDAHKTIISLMLISIVMLFL